MSAANARAAAATASRHSRPAYSLRVWAKITERLAATIATGGSFSTASSVGAGLSAQKTLSHALSAFADARAVMPVSSRDRDGLALNRRPVLDATVGVEHHVTATTTLTTQIDFAGSPYARTGLPAYDNNYTDLTFGLSHRLARAAVVTICGSDNFNTGKGIQDKVFWPLMDPPISLRTSK